MSNTTVEKAAVKFTGSVTNGYLFDVTKTGENATSAQIDARIKSIRSRGRQLRSDCHATLCMVINHYVVHGDMTKVQPLHDAIKSSLGNSVAKAYNQWIHNYVPSLAWDKEGKAFVHKKGAKRMVIDATYEFEVDGEVKTYKGTAYAIPFYNLEVESSTAPKEFSAKILSMMKALHRDIESGKIVNVDTSFLRDLDETVIKSGFVKPEDIGLDQTSPEEILEAAEEADKDKAVTAEIVEAAKASKKAKAA
jgi:hypothetical protein